MKLIQADTNYSKFIRQRDSVKGICTCPLCDWSGSWQSFACGHFIKRRHLSTRWHEDNALAICFQCNNKMESDTALADRYAQIILDRIGAERWEKLMKLRLSNEKIMQHEIDEISKHYKQLWKSLKQ